MENKLIKARKFYENGHLQEALALYLEEEKDKPLDENSLIDIALIYDELKDYETAKIYYHKVLDVNMDNPIAYYGLGTIYDTLEKDEEAIAFYKEAIRLEPNYYEAHFFLANIYDDLTENHLAIYHYEKVIILKPDYFYAYLNLGALYERLNQNKKALQLFHKANQINSDNHLLHFNYGVVYRKLGQIDFAIKSYEKSLELSNTHPYTYLNLAIIYKDDLNDLNKAIEIYTNGIIHHPNEAVLFYNRACAYALLQQNHQAVDDLKRAYDLDKLLYDYLITDDELADLRKTSLFRKTFHSK